MTLDHVDAFHEDMLVIENLDHRTLPALVRPVITTT